MTTPYPPTKSTPPDMALDMNGEEGSPPFTPPSSPSPAKRQVATANGVSRGPFLIGVAGGTASGKTTVCHNIMAALDSVNSSNKRVVVISQDSFYKNLTRKEIALANIGEYNFDHPGNVVYGTCYYTSLQNYLHLHCCVYLVVYFFMQMPLIRS